MFKSPQPHLFFKSRYNPLSKWLELVCISLVCIFLRPYRATLHFAAQPGDLIFQITNDVAVLTHVVPNVEDVFLDFGGDTVGPVGVHQGVPALVEVGLPRRNVCYHNGAAVSTQRVFQQPGQLGITIINVPSPTCQGVYTVTQCQKGPVYVRSFLQSFSVTLKLIIIFLDFFLDFF